MSSLQTMLSSQNNPAASASKVDHTNSLAIDKQEVVAGAGFQRNFTQGDAARGRRIELLVILHDPAARRELRIDLLPGKLFRSFRHGLRSNVAGSGAGRKGQAIWKAVASVVFVFGGCGYYVLYIRMGAPFPIFPCQTAGSTCK